MASFESIEVGLFLSFFFYFLFLSLIKSWQSLWSNGHYGPQVILVVYVNIHNLRQWTITHALKLKSVDKVLEIVWSMFSLNKKKFVLFLLSFFPFVLFTINLFLAFYLFCENIFFHFFVYSHWSTIYVVWLFDSINFYLFVLFWNCFMTLKVRIQIKNANWCLSTMGSMS